MPGAAEYAVVVEDVDAADKPATWPERGIMWVVYRIPKSAAGLPAGMRQGTIISGTLKGTTQGITSFYSPGGGGGLAYSMATAEYSSRGGCVPNPVEKENGVTSC